MRLVRHITGRLHRPRHATVVAYVAAFLALTTGGAWAAAKVGSKGIKNNAIHSRHIANGSIRARDLHKGAVTGSKIAANAVTATKIAANAVTATQIAANSVSGAKVADGSLSGTDLADGSVGTTKLGDASVTNGKLAPDAVTSDKVANNSLTGNDIDESTLGQVPDSARVGGRTPASFLSSTVQKFESALGPGTRLTDNTNVMSEPCPAGTILLSGGPANVNANSKLLESFPTPGTTNSWSARINDDGTADNFSVVVLCVRQ